MHYSTLNVCNYLKFNPIIEWHMSKYQKMTITKSVIMIWYQIPDDQPNNNFKAINADYSNDRGQIYCVHW